MVVHFVLCLDVQNIWCCWRRMYVLIYLVKFRLLSGHLLGKSAHSAYDMFSWYKYLIVN